LTKRPKTCNQGRSSILGVCKRGAEGLNFREVRPKKRKFQTITEQVQEGKWGRGKKLWHNA